MAESTHRVEVVPVELQPHPNADTLSIVKVYGYQVIVKTEQWQGISLGAYCPPDSLVPPEFVDKPAEDSKQRIKARRLRGEWSQGLLVPAPTGSKEGDDVAELLGVEHYEPPISTWTSGGQLPGGDAEKGPGFFAPYYDVEAWYRYKHLLTEGEPVALTEKIHGANSRFVWADDRLYCGSRSQWKKESEVSPWWMAVKQNPWIAEFCKAHPGKVLYGEIYGWIQDLRYGANPGQVWFRAFDVLDGGSWLDMADPIWAEIPNEHQVPLLYMGSYSEAIVMAYVDGQSTIPGAAHIREGIVIKPLRERTTPEIGRVILKVVSNKYLEKAK